MPTAESAISAGSQGPKTVRIAAWALAAAIVILSLVPPTLRPETGVPHGLEHFTIFAATGFAFGLGYKRRHHLVAILLVIFSSAIEIAQLFVPGRHARLGDFIIGALAACIGLVMASLFSSAPVRT
jgi:VanZ family protein